MPEDNELASWEGEGGAIYDPASDESQAEMDEIFQMAQPFITKTTFTY